MKVMVFFQSTTKREMPYADPERQREAVKVWQQSHPEKLKAYRKTMFMRNSIAKHRFPKQRSIQQHGLTDAEVIHLVENVLASLRASTEDELGRAGDELGRAEDELSRSLPTGTPKLTAHSPSGTTFKPRVPPRVRRCLSILRYLPMPRPSHFE